MTSLRDKKIYFYRRNFNKFTIILKKHEISNFKLIKIKLVFIVQLLQLFIYNKKLKPKFKHSRVYLKLKDSPGNFSNYSGLIWKHFFISIRLKIKALYDEVENDQNFEKISSFTLSLGKRLVIGLRYPFKQLFLFKKNKIKCNWVSMDFINSPHSLTSLRQKAKKSIISGILYLLQTQLRVDDI